MGIEVQILAADNTIDFMDTVLALTDENCEPLDLYSFCGDDNSQMELISLLLRLFQMLQLI